MNDGPSVIVAPRISPVKSTRSEELQTRLAEAIVTGRLPPGSALDEVQLAAEYSVSRTPVREALRQLSSSGLVEIRPHRGAVVAKPDRAQLTDMFLVMGELEALSAALCAVNMIRSDRLALESLHQSMSALVREGDLPGYSAANVEFHVAIYRGSGNAYLAEMASATRRRLAPFRRAQFEGRDRLAHSHHEHDAIVQAIQRGDGDRASSAMRQHIGLSAKAWDVLSRAPAPV
ncbi:GntR family transcriptional regulator [Phreatobacter aquaticus]|uniref:GntR family transcriptional regulator n=1 Tax=Phreatobacter aquaticus TaxID=2570229 RepID=A0A4D7QEJ5_9HYPH|nr:GntR family transcriptional regulator [Phreatobacter aquaticus]QCK84971.1 GntR family transcriptional regulator [Phreatobacter aquaticus]